jgi:hypothetical protein
MGQSRICYENADFPFDQVRFTERLPSESADKMSNFNILVVTYINVGCQKVLMYFGTEL